MTPIRCVTLVAIALVLCSCSDSYCPPKAELLDIAVRCHDANPDARACEALESLSRTCIECRKMQMMERNEAMQRMSGECRGVRP